MTIYALEGFAEQVFTPEHQEKEDNPTRFKIKPLDGESFTNLYLMLDGTRLTGDSVSYALRMGLVGWENYMDSKGAVAFSLHNARNIPMLDRIAIASEIYSISMLSEAQVKNS